MRPRLRLFTGEDLGPVVAEPPVSVRFGEMMTALTHAMRCNRTWPHDFEDEEIQIPTDLYEVISAYSHLHPSA
ncbi:MAG: hypothetical protein ACE5KM_00185 [Planctomycetaceae bacterium]